MVRNKSFPTGKQHPLGYLRPAHPAEYRTLRGAFTSPDTTTCAPHARYN